MPSRLRRLDVCRARVWVERLLAIAEAAGATLAKPAQDAFWGGRTGYFADPDGHLLKVASNPHFKLTGDGALRHAAHRAQSGRHSAFVRHFDERDAIGNAEMFRMHMTVRVAERRPNERFRSKAQVT